MDTNKQVRKPKEKTFTEKARTKQIIECTIDVITEIGYANTSIGKIAQKATVSKGVITYHFSDKEELMTGVVVDLYQKAALFMEKHMQNPDNAIDMLRAYIVSNLLFIKENRKHVAAVIEIVTNDRNEQGELRFAEQDEAIYGPLEEIFQYGQEVEGTFRSFSKRFMAVMLRSAIDAAGYQLAKNDQFDIDLYAEELVTMYDRATRK